MQLQEVTIAELQNAMAQGQLTSRQLTEMYIARIHEIDQNGPTLNAVIEINPDALEIATALDNERAQGNVRGPLHGIPILLKDNIATLDRMQTTAGSLALLNSRPPRDAFVAHKLREAGAVILGKANLSEWANIRSSVSSSGWSARGGQARNPYVLDRTPSGSSSGSATAVAANLVTVSLGTETDGSILGPASANGVVGIKPTVGLTSRSGVIPIAHSQDTVGPFARTVTDAAIVLGAITGIDEHDPATSAREDKFYYDYTQFLAADGLRGARIGVARQTYFGRSPKADTLIEVALQQMAEQGAIIIDPANIPTSEHMTTSEAELCVLLYELKADLNAYLSTLIEAPVRTLEEIIAFNKAHAAEELPFFDQDLFERAQATTGLDNPEYLAALAENQRLARQEGIDAIMEHYQLDALIVPTSSPAWCIDHINGDHDTTVSTQPAALAGYPAISVPAGTTFELPVGITFIGQAYSEPTLIKLAYAFEQATKHRTPPRFLPTTN
jgi:amidase